MRTTPEQRAEINRRADAGEAYSKIAADLGISHQLCRFHHRSAGNTRKAKWSNQWHQHADGSWIVSLLRLGEKKGEMLIDDGDKPTVSSYIWRLGNSGYAVTTRRSMRYELHRVMFPAPDGLDVDHINRNKLDNRRSNLRHVTRAENINNTDAVDDARAKRLTLKYKVAGNVGWVEKINRWVARQGRHHLGCYHTKEEAQLAVDAYLWWKNLPKNQPPSTRELVNQYTRALLTRAG